MRDISPSNQQPFPYILTASFTHCHANWIEELNGAFTEPTGFMRDIAWETLTQTMMFGCEMSPVDLMVLSEWYNEDGCGTFRRRNLVVRSTSLGPGWGFIAIPHFLFGASWV